MSNHTPEPWCKLNDCGTVGIWGPQGDCVAVNNGCSCDNEANADRIVACVNACAGLNPEAVPDVVEALKQCERELLQMRIEDAARWTPDYKKQLEHAESGLTIIKARAALAKLEDVG